MSIIKVFIDLETTGVDPKKNSIHEIGGLVEVDNEIKQSFRILTKPHPKAIIEDGALKVCRKTLEEVQGYQDMKLAYREFISVLDQYINRFNPKEKAWVVGFNNRYFDDVFLRAWFKQNNDEFIGSWFWTDTLDTLVLASQYLIERRVNMPSFKLHRVAKELGIEVDEAQLHDPCYDVNLTRRIYRIVTGLELEI